MQFELEAGFADALQSLEDRRKKIELVATHASGDKLFATVYVPKGQLSTFEHKVRKYADVDTPAGRPTHQRLVAPLSAIRLAALRDFWTDSDAEFPQLTSVIRWEIWIRDEPDVVAQFERNIVAAGVELSPSHLNFPERRVYLARGTAEQIAASIEVIDAIAELRRAKESRDFFVQLRGPEAREWTDELLSRVDLHENPSSICLLDSGLNAGHPLLEPFSDPRLRLGARPEWGANDQIGHGTQMAGVPVRGAHALREEERTQVPQLPSLGRGGWQLPAVRPARAIRPVAFDESRITMLAVFTRRRRADHFERPTLATMHAEPRVGVLLRAADFDDDLCLYRQRRGENAENDAGAHAPVSQKWR